jgi:hypothetical protein
MKSKKGKHVRVKPRRAADLGGRRAMNGHGTPPEVVEDRRER